MPAFAFSQVSEAAQAVLQAGGEAAFHWTGKALAWSSCAHFPCIIFRLVGSSPVNTYPNRRFSGKQGAPMHERNALSCAALLLTLAAPAFAQDAKPSTAAEDVIQDPMPRSRLASTTPGGSTRTPPSLPAGSPAKAASAGPVAAAGEQVEQAAPTTAVSLNPAMLLLGGIGVEVDHAVGSNVSFFVAPSFIFGDSVFSTNSNVSMTGFGGDVGLRFYTEPHAPRGFWISPHAGLAFVNATAGTLEANATAFAFGGMLGYSWITDSSFYFSLGAGADYTIASVEGRGISNSAKGASLSLRLALGIAQ